MRHAPQLIKSIGAWETLLAGSCQNTDTKVMDMITCLGRVVSYRAYQLVSLDGISLNQVLQFYSTTVVLLEWFR